MRLYDLAGKLEEFLSRNYSAPVVHYPDLQTVDAAPSREDSGSGYRFYKDKATSSRKFALAGSVDIVRATTKRSSETTLKRRLTARLHPHAVLINRAGACTSVTRGNIRARTIPILPIGCQPSSQRRSARLARQIPLTRANHSATSTTPPSLHIGRKPVILQAIQGCWIRSGFTTTSEHWGHVRVTTLGCNCTTNGCVGPFVGVSWNIQR